MATKTINVKGEQIAFIKNLGEDYISLTDIARHRNPKEPKDVVKNWMRSRGSIEFLGLWEKINNPNFKGGRIRPPLETRSMAQKTNFH